MEKIITKIQNNKTINSFKDAANSLAFLNIALAISILLMKKFNIGIDLKLVYEISMVFMGALMLYLFVNKRLEHKRESLKIAVIFVSFLNLIPFLNKPESLPAYPIIASFLSLIPMVIANWLNENLIKPKDSSPTAAIDYLNQILPILVTFIVGSFSIYMLSQKLDVILDIYISIVKLFSTYPAVILLIIMICGFWYSGLHGVTVISSVMRPFWFQMALYNAYFFITDQPIFFIGSEIFFQWFIWLGGSGATLGLSFSLKYLARSKELQDLGEKSHRSSLHNINEAIIFGVPISQNKYFKIPFFLTPIVLSSIGYAMIYFGVIPGFSLVSPWVLPIPLGAYISSGLSLKVLIISIGMIMISWVIYYPFFRKYDQILLKKRCDD